VITIKTPKGQHQYQATSLVNQLRAYFHILIEMDNQKFAIVQWIDKFTSIINLDAVKLPRKPLEDYTEGEYVTALYGKKKYEARISEISGKSNLLYSRPMVSSIDDFDFFIDKLFLKTKLCSLQ